MEKCPHVVNLLVFAFSYNINKNVSTKMQLIEK